jgi:hypothetical protein
MSARRLWASVSAGPFIRLSGLLLVFLCTSWSVAQEPAEGSRSPIARQVGRIERIIEALRERGEDELANEYEQRLQAGLASFEQSLFIPEPREAPEASSEAELEAVQAWIAELRAAGLTDVADELRDRLQPLEQAVETGTYEIPASDEPEVHGVELVRGSTLPDEFKDGTNRFKLGYAEVRVDYTARPVILVLSGAEPILWKVTTADDVRIHAIVLFGEGHEVLGISGPLTLTQREARGPALATRVQSVTGRPLATSLQEGAYPGQPIVVGPASADWARQYLRPQIRELAAEARTALRTRRLAELESLRFEAVYFPPPLARDRFESPAPSFGEFTLAGPLAETLRPLAHDSLREVVTVSTEPPLQFALSNQQEFVVLEGDAFPEDLTKVPLSSELPGRARFRSLAYDAKRNRLILAPLRNRKLALYAYDIATGETSELQELDASLACLAYAPDEDVLWAVTTGSDLQALRLLKLAPDGRLLTEVELPDIPLSQPAHWAHRGGSQLVPVDGRLVLLISPFRPPTDQSPGQPEDSIYVVDPGTGQVVYTGPVQVQYPGEGPQVSDRPPSQVAADGELAELDRKFRRAEGSIARLREAGEIGRVNALSARLDDLRQAMQGTLPKRNDERLYLVGTYESHATTVRVTDKSGPITLAVCSYEPGTWTIEADEGVDLRRIIVGGYHAQKVTSSPQGVPISIHSYEQGGGGFHTYGPESDGHERAVQQLKEYTDLEIAALIGTYGYGDGKRTVLVGPENGRWRIQEIAGGLDRLIAEANVEDRDGELAKIDRHRFYALHFGTLPRQPQPQPQRRRGVGPTPIYVAPFTTSGPLIAGGRPISGEVHASAIDPTGRTCYVRVHDEFHAIDLATGTETPIAFDNELPRLSWPTGLAFDSKRQRLLLTSHGGGGNLYAYDLADEEWSVVRRPGIGNSCIAYAADQDIIYSLDPDRGDGMLRAVKRYNAHGAYLDAITLSRTIRAGGRIPGRESGLQLVYVEGHLVLLSYSHGRHPAMPRPMQQQPAEATITVIDARDGQIVYEGTLTPHVERRELTDEQLKEVWEKLATAEEDEADQLMWELAAGHEATVDFLAVQFRQAAPEVNADVPQLIEQLDSETFAEREAAYKSLVALGSRIAPDVRQAIEEHKDSTEIQARLRNLVQGWESAEPPTARDLRQVRAVEALARLATPGAKALLELIADGQGNYAANRRAALVLEELDTSVE